MKIPLVTNIRVSLSTKMIVLVILAAIFSSVPVIYMSYRESCESSINSETQAIGNILRLVLDNLDAQFNSLTSVSIIKNIRAQKSGMNIIADMVAHKNLETPSSIEKHFDNVITVDNNTYAMSFYDRRGNAIIENPLIEECFVKDTADIYGRSFESFFRVASRYPNGKFTVLNVNLPGEKNSQWIQIYARPIHKLGTIVLAKALGATAEISKQFTYNLIDLMKLKFESINVNMGTIAIFDGNRNLLMAKGSMDGLENLASKNFYKYAGAGFKEILDEDDNSKYLINVKYVLGMNWFLVGIVSVDVLEDPAENLALQQCMSVVLFLLLVVSFMAFLTVKTITPLRLLTNNIRKLSEKNFEEKYVELLKSLLYSIQNSRKDEIGELSTSFYQMLQAYREKVQNLVEVTSQAKRMEGELTAARDIQMGILPTNDTIECVTGCSLWVFIEPAKEVGGDLYDSFITKGGYQAIILGDVSGKGVPAALFMSMTITLIRAALLENKDPAVAMKWVNDLLASNNPNCMFVTLFIALYNPENGEILYANGGHCSPRIVKHGEQNTVRMLDGVSGPLVGVMPEAEFVLYKDKIEEGENLFVYSDGVSEAMNEQFQMLEEKAMVETLKNSTCSTPKVITEDILHAVTTHRGNAVQSDDITMICFSRN